MLAGIRGGVIEGRGIYRVGVSLVTEVNELALLGGTLVALTIATLLVTIWFKSRKERQLRKVSRSRRTRQTAIDLMGPGAE